MSEYPQFFNTNQNIIETDDISFYSGEGTIYNAIDYDRNTKYESTGSNDSTTEYLDITFYTADGEHESRTLDKLILLNTNVKYFKLYKNNWNGSGWDGWVEVLSVTNNADSSLIESFTQISTYRVKLEMYTTIVANQDKYVGEFIVTSLLYEATMPMDVFNIKDIQDKNIQRLYDGTAQMVVFYNKWAASIEFHQISKTELNNLKDIYDLNTAFIVILEPYDYNGDYDKPEECYRVIWTSAWEQKYYTNVKGAGYNVKLTLEEV